MMGIKTRLTSKMIADGFVDFCLNDFLPVLSEICCCNFNCVNHNIHNTGCNLKCVTILRDGKCANFAEKKLEDSK